MDRLSVKPYALKYGVVLGIFFALYGFMLMQVNASWNMTDFVLIAGLFLMYREYKQYSGGLMTYKKGVKLGFAVVVVSALVSAFISFGLAKLDPTMVEQQVALSQELVREQLDPNPQLTDEQIDMAVEMAAYMATPPMAQVLSFFGITISGGILVLIIAVFAKRTVPTTLGGKQ